MRELERIRRPLFRELEVLLEDPDYHRGEPPHLCCQKARNQMRISPLEAEAIARAFRLVPELRKQLPRVLARLEEELRSLKDTTSRQSFNCPLLDGTRCLVHSVAKPIGCTAWNPGRDFTEVGWQAFAERDALNDRVYGPHWKLRVIPLWLKRVLDTGARRGGPRGKPGAPPGRGG